MGFSRYLMELGKFSSDKSSCQNIHYAPFVVIWVLCGECFEMLQSEKWLSGEKGVSSFEHMIADL